MLGTGTINILAGREGEMLAGAGGLALSRAASALGPQLKAGGLALSCAASALVPQAQGQAL